MHIGPYSHLGDLPAPLTPADCDLRKLAWMPIYIDKVLHSEFWRTASSDIRAASFELWCLSWRQTPAASLPDNDVWLAHYVGFGRDVEAWRSIKAAVLSPWILCSDNRFYHPTLAQIAIEQMALLTRKDRDRKHAALRKAKSRAQKTGASSKSCVTRDAEEERRPRIDGAERASIQKKVARQ